MKKLGKIQVHDDEQQEMKKKNPEINLSESINSCREEQSIKPQQLDQSKRLC